MTSEGRLSRQAKAGQWLRDQRIRHGYATAAEFGRAVGVSKEVMSNYEVGRSTVPEDRAERIAEVLGIDIITVRRNLGLWVPEGVTAAQLEQAGRAEVAGSEGDFEEYDRHNEALIRKLSITDAEKEFFISLYRTNRQREREREREERQRSEDARRDQLGA